MKPLVMQEYKRKHGITSLYPKTFLYYGLRGTNVFWSAEFCQTHCEVHTTFGINFSRVWSMEQNNATNDVRFHVRASQNIHIRLYPTPAMEYPSITVTINKDITMLIFQENEESMKHYLKEIPTRGILDFWTWKEFSISIFGEHFRLFSQKVRAAVELLYISNIFFASLRWFSIGSENTIAQWTLFCTPEGKMPLFAADAVEEPTSPNCISDSKAYEYKGTQWTSDTELPCIPWISKTVPSEDKLDNKFVDGSALKALNKCRNPTRDINGPYCYVFASEKDETISKKYCSLRNCRSSECRMAGTANDYVGKLSETRSGRTCDDWPIKYNLSSTTEQSTKSMFTMHTKRRTRVKPLRTGPPENPYPLLYVSTTITTTPEYSTIPVSKSSLFAKAKQDCFNDSLYPDGSAKSARNYCRNPSRNIAGTWCYTTDPSVPQDLCNVRDCEKPEKNTILIRGNAVGRRLYVLPEYRFEGLRFAVKAWEPDQPDSITFVFTADDGFKSRYILKIGALDNEKVLLYYESETEAITLVKKKTLPHLLYLGKWSNFVISIPRGKVLLYYEDDPIPLFEWNHVDPSNAFLPMYYYYSSERGRTIGITFDKDSGCHLETTKTDRYVKILSLSAWSKEDVTHPEQVTFHIRGKGVISIPLLLLPATPGKENWKQSIKTGEHTGLLEEILDTIDFAITNFLPRISDIQAKAELTSHHAPIIFTPNEKRQYMEPKSITTKFTYWPAFQENINKKSNIFYVITLSEADRWVVLTRHTYPNVTMFHRQKAMISLFTTHSWTNVTIRWLGNIIEVFSNTTNVFFYKHVSPLLFYFFSIGVASGGWITWSVNCVPIDIDGPPIDGGWSEWGPWACSASCNGGSGIRKRRCNSPKPNIKGEPCIGPNTMTGRCNEILCGDVTEDTITLVNQRIRMNHTALIIKEFESTRIASDPDIVALIGKESPHSKLQWSLNGIFVQKEAGRVEIKDFNVEIIKASPNDSGVYAMTLRRIDETYSIIKVISLAVIPLKENVQVRETLSMTALCHCAILGYVYSELKVSWLVENKTWKDYGITLPLAADTEHILQVNRTHEGLWQCTVKQSDLNFNWITNIIVVKVLGPPNWRTHLMEDQATRFIFDWLPDEKYVGVLAIIISLLLISAVIAGSIFYFRNYNYQVQGTQEVSADKKAHLEAHEMMKAVVNNNDEVIKIEGRVVNSDANKEIKIATNNAFLKELNSEDKETTGTKNTVPIQMKREKIQTMETNLKATQPENAEGKFIDKDSASTTILKGDQEEIKSRKIARKRHINRYIPRNNLTH
ncbi:uncharacterized protein LOC143154114 [Ptiloglossa arizonensis]|uniref:uncharacterized protein LOC143154114 n=1 Tax=Ptiloglossa arizonensis TaxID=3350558 RepID=UPI003F9F5736